MFSVNPTHTTASAVSDGGDSTLVLPSDWNAVHNPKASLTYFAFEEDFIWLNTTDLRLGSMNLDTSSVTTISALTGVANHPGILRLSRNTGASAFMAVKASGTPTVPFHTRGVLRYVWVVRFSTISATSNTRVRYGLGDVDAASFGVDAVHFEFDVSISAKWRAITRASSTSTTVTSGAADVAADTWYQLEARYDSGAVSWEFFVNDASIGTSSTNIPNVMQNFGLEARNFSGSTQTYDIDYMALTCKFTGNRYS